MQFLKQNKMYLYGGVILILSVIAYNMFFGGESAGTLATTQEDPTSAVSRSLLVTLSNLNVIRLDQTLFEDPLFLSLSDFGVEIPLEQAGRRNPFAPL